MKVLFKIIVAFFTAIMVVGFLIFSYLRLLIDSTDKVQYSNYARRHYQDIYQVACEFDDMGDILEIFMSILIQESNDNQDTHDKLGSGYTGTNDIEGYRHAISNFQTLYDYGKSVGVTDIYHIVQAYHYQYYKVHQIIIVDDAVGKDYLDWVVANYSPTIRYTNTLAGNYLYYIRMKVYQKKRQEMITAYIDANKDRIEPEPSPPKDRDGNPIPYFSESDLRREAEVYVDSVWVYSMINYGRSDYAFDVLKRTRYDYVHSGEDDLAELGPISTSDIVRIAECFLGKPYVSPDSDPPNSFDCSSFTRYVYKKVDININSQAYTQYNQATIFYDESLAQPGDLVFFQDTRTDGKLRIAKDGRNITHVGIYKGDGWFIHASSSSGVKNSKLSEGFYKSHFASFGRISP